jgi:hypothetical protein
MTSITIQMRQTIKVLYAMLVSNIVFCFGKLENSFMVKYWPLKKRIKLKYLLCLWLMFNFKSFSKGLANIYIVVFANFFDNWTSNLWDTIHCPNYLIMWIPHIYSWLRLFNLGLSNFFFKPNKLFNMKISIVSHRCSNDF